MLILKWFALGAAALIAGILIYAATRPDDFRVARTASINAAPEAIFPLINDLRKFNSWNPFYSKDEGNLIYNGPESGKGAAHEWDGGKAGKGRIEISESRPPSKVVMALDMLKPLEAHNRVEFTLAPQGDGTAVTWAMEGRQPFLGKLISVFIDCDKMVGGQFELGLSNLKALIESPGSVASR